MYPLFTCVCHVYKCALYIYTRWVLLLRLYCSVAYLEASTECHKVVSARVWGNHYNSLLLHTFPYGVTRRRCCDETTGTNGEAGALRVTEGKHNPRAQRERARKTSQGWVSVCCVGVCVRASPVMTSSGVTQPGLESDKRRAQWISC